MSEIYFYFILLLFPTHTTNRNLKSLNIESAVWAETLPVLESPLCAVIDPLRDFRWHALRCGGPATAAFLCEMEGKPFRNTYIHSSCCLGSSGWIEELSYRDAPYDSHHHRSTILIAFRFTSIVSSRLFFCQLSLQYRNGHPHAQFLQCHR